MEIIAQVDMKQRIHRNQRLLVLSKMSFEILQVALRRVGEAQGERLWEEANSTLKLVTTQEGRLHLELHDIATVERPPSSEAAVTPLSGFGCGLLLLAAI